MSINCVCVRGLKLCLFENLAYSIFVFNFSGPKHQMYP